MIEKFKNLSIFYRCFVISIFVWVLLFLLMIPLIIFNWGEISYGLALGEFISFIFCLITGIFVSSKRAKDKKALLITMITLRLLILGGVLFLVGYLYYSKGIHLFNIFAVIGGYFIPLTILMILALRERRV